MGKKASAVALALALSGCAGSYPISKDLRQEASKKVTFDMARENPDAYQGTLVIWGGEIVETKNTKQGSEVFVLDTPLEGHEYPESSHYGQGRFIAKTVRFLDPKVYKAGRKVTIAGVIVGSELGKIGGSSYRYPVLQMDQLALWPRPRPVVVPDYYAWDWYDPYAWDGGWDWDDDWYEPGYYAYGNDWDEDND